MGEFEAKTKKDILQKVSISLPTIAFFFFLTHCWIFSCAIRFYVYQPFYTQYRKKGMKSGTLNIRFDSIVDGRGAVADKNSQTMMFFFYSPGVQSRNCSKIVSGMKFNRIIRYYSGYYNHSPFTIAPNRYGCAIGIRCANRNRT